MRKMTIIALVTLLAVTLIGASAYAWKGGGFGGYSGNCPIYGAVEPEKAQKFYNDTLPLRQQQLQLKGELMQLYAQPNPDWNAISQKRQEMAKLMTEIQKKAQEYGLGYGFGRMQGFGNCPRCW